MKPGKITERLQESQANGQLVQITREDVEMWPLVGVVVELGKWVLVATVNRQLQAQGFDAVRLRDITRVETPMTHELIDRVAQATGRQLVRTPAAHLDLSSTKSLARSVVDAKAFVALFTYSHRTGHEVDAYSGRIGEIRNRVVAFDRLAPNGSWDPSPLSLPMSEIARFSFDSVRLRTVQIFSQDYPGGPHHPVDSSATLPDAYTSSIAEVVSPHADNPTEPGDDFLGSL